MSIKRSPRKNKPYVNIEKTLSEDSTLSWESRGLMVYLLGKPDYWEVSVNHLKTQGTAGRDKIYKMINELITAGWIIREQSRKEGKANGWDYIILDEKQHTDFQDAEEIDQHTDFQDAVFQEAEKPTQVSNEYKQVMNNNNKPLCSNDLNAPKPDENEPDWADLKKQLSESIIDDFWQNYPKKVDKKKSIELLRKMINKNDSESFWYPILAHLREKAAVTPKSFWPSPYRFLHDEKWNDEIIDYDFSKPALNPDTNSFTFPQKSHVAKSTRHTSLVQSLTDTSWANGLHECENGITVEFHPDCKPPF